MEDAIMNMVFGQSGAGMIVALIMGAIKKVWKPKVKELYWIPAFVASAIASWGVLWYLDAFSLWVFLLSTVMIAGFEYISQNEAFDGIKAIFKAVFIKLVK